MVSSGAGDHKTSPFLYVSELRWVFIGSLSGVKRVIMGSRTFWWLFLNIFWHFIYEIWNRFIKKSKMQIGGWFPSVSSRLLCSVFWWSSRPPPLLQATHRRVCLRRSPALCLTSPASRWIPSPWTTRSGWTRWLWTCWKATWCWPTRLWRTLFDLTGWSDPGPPLLQELGGTRRRDGHPGGGGMDRDRRRSAAHSPLPQPDGLQSEVWKQLGNLQEASCWWWRTWEFCRRSERDWRRGSSPSKALNWKRSCNAWSPDKPRCFSF